MNTEIIIENGSVYELHKDGDEVICKCFKCAALKLVVTGGKSSMGIGETLSLHVELRDWQDTPIPDRSQKITVSVAHEEGDPVVIALEAVGGKAEFDFMSNSAGTFLVRAVADEVTHEPGVFCVEVQ
ncbi:hypothetical protein H1S01_18515 [Heliobacterium chlorum]|uniref:Uncharacterized protein n=1 Tax=Heliobacterium chlorum TaxID=2698 RepID=A0ABR7T6R6_HELCL|nr:hypothetical protein [Heliobacterium chlorum]MBC9786453.1 hypothetical protein [Heliobacterium chlorum]